MGMRSRFVHTVAVFLILAGQGLFALDISNPYSDLAGFFEGFVDENEGLTTFRSLMIPAGGRAEALGSSFTALANDIGFFESNPAGSSTIKNTELAVFHNNWIADSRLETVSFATRFDNLGLGASIRCFYVPFTEYNTFGERVSRGYYSETFATLNVSYNFLAGYYFKGIAVGANIKAGYRSIPDYSDNYGHIDEDSGNEQSAFAIMADVGAQTRFNLFKLYNAREPNFNVGLSLRNVGPPVLGEPLPTLATLGLSWKPAAPVTIAAEVQQPLNLVDPHLSGTMYYGAGVMVEFLSMFTFIGGLQLKGANPRMSIGGEFTLKDLQFNVNYTLDMTTQAALFNRISLSAKLSLGDRGRAVRAKQVEELYIEGLKLYASGKLEEAIAVWQEALAMDKRFDPAVEGVNAASTTLAIQRRIKEIQQLD